MIGILKILFTLTVILVVYLGFKYRWRMNDMSRAMARMAGVKVNPPTQPTRSGVPAAQELVPCRRCGAYVPAGSSCSCERA